MRRSSKRIVLSWGSLEDAHTEGCYVLAAMRHQQCWQQLYYGFGLELGMVKDRFLLAVDVFGIN